MCVVKKQTTIHKSFTCSEAIVDPCWVDALNKELSALGKNNTGKVVPPPPSKRLVVPQSSVFGARLVAKGYTQIEGQDYYDTFSPIAKMDTVRTLLAICVIK